ncbi:MAG: AAA family ATPase [Bacteroidales bacterium]|nr:AAA family ATPase [Bacteroidales bacterium]
MDKLFQYSIARIDGVSTAFKRYLWTRVNWDNRLNIITGARGVGKTTLLLQYIKENLFHKPDEVIFVNLDDLYFSRNTLVDFVDAFVKRGGKHIFIDEVHKYRNWSQEVKNVYDYFPGLKIIITGSSARDIYKGQADLSRRAILYKMNGLSFREFIELKHGHYFPALELEEILRNPMNEISAILKRIKPIKLFEKYLISGYYPFFTEGEPEYHTRLKQTVNHILDIDLPSVENIDFNAVYKLKKLVSILSEIVPYKPNISKLSGQIGVSRETLVKYLYLLERADLLMLLQAGTHGISKMNKPEKIYLNNSNLVATLASDSFDVGTMRETFFYNQLQVNHNLRDSDRGDFVVDNKYTFEIRGKHKTMKQITGIDNAFIATDNIEFSSRNIIPLWLFGFLY